MLHRRFVMIGKAPRLFAMAGLAATLGVFGACGGDEDNDDNGGGAGTGTQGSACSSDSECGTGLICIPTATQSLEQKDMACFVSCAQGCGMDEACALACLEECDVTCADICEGDADCIAECEAGGSGGGGGGTSWEDATPGMCTNTCNFADDGECDDGRPGSETDFCDPGTDCNDCGAVPGGGGGGGGEEVSCAEFCADFPAEQQAACIAACDGAGGGGGGGEVPSTCAELCADFPAEIQADCVSACEADDGVIGGGDGGGGGGGGGTATGTCQPDPNAGGGADAGGTPDAGGGGEDTGGGEAPIDWAGTWSGSFTYSVSCDLGFDNIRTADHSHIETGSLSASGNTVTAVFASQDEYTMTGPGSDTRLTLSGQFPVRDYDGNITRGTVSADNAISIVLDNIVDNDNVSGSFSGQFQGQFGADCTISEGTATFSR